MTLEMPWIFRMTISSSLASVTEMVREKMAKPSAVVCPLTLLTEILQVLSTEEISTSNPGRSLHTTSREVL